MSKPRKLITKDFLKSVIKFSVTTGCISEAIAYFSYNSTLYMNAVFWLVDKMGILFYQFLVFFCFSPSEGYLSLGIPYSVVFA
jgi:hypothetical protein